MPRLRPALLAQFARLLMMAGLLVCAGVASAQVSIPDPGDVDTSYNPDVDGTVWSIVTQPDGKVIIGGDFTMVGGVTRNNLARLNADGSLDGSFNPNVNDLVTCIAVQADGRIVIGGLFTQVGGTPRNDIVRLQPTGGIDTTFNLSLNGDVYAIAFQKDGKMLIGGKFSQVGGVPTGMLARVDANGTLDTAFTPGVTSSQLDLLIRSVIVQPDGKILVGGNFEEAGGFPQPYVVRLDATGVIDFNFMPSLDGGLTSMLLLADGKVMIAGPFTQVDGSPQGGVARLNDDGSNDNTFTGFTDGIIFSMAQQADGKVILGGDFTHATSGTVRHRIARLLTDGSVDATFVDPDADAEVYALALQADGKLLAGGEFSLVGGETRNCLARLHNDEATSVLAETSSSRVEWLRDDSAPEVSEVTFQVSQDGGTVYRTLGTGTRIAGGWELTGLNLPASGFVRARGRVMTGGNGTTGLVEAVTGFPKAGAVDLAFAPAMNSLPATMAVQPDGKILIGGSFTQVNGVPRSYVARLLKDGTLDSAFRSTGSGPNNSVTRLAVQPDGKILIAGAFTQVDGQAKSRIARLNADGGLDTSFDVGAGTGGPLVSAITPLPDGKILLGGYFSSFNGQAYGSVVRLNASGSVDTSFTANAYGNVYSIVRQPDGKIVIGGEQGIFRANANGTVDPGFNVGTAPNNFVLNVAVQADNKILMTGMFTTVGGLARSKIARLNPDGSVESTATFNPGSGPSGTFLGGAMECLALQADGKILIAGDLTFMDGQARNGIARLNSDGSIESLGSFDIGTGVASTFPGVNSLALDGEGGILIGGAITSVNGTVRSGLVRLINHTASQSLTAPAASTVRWLRSGTLPETNQVSFELSTNAGANWTTLGEGTRMPGGWQLTGQSLPASGYLRARATVQSGTGNGSAGILESLAPFGPLSLPDIAVFDGNSTSAENLRGDNSAPVIAAAVPNASGVTRTFTIKNTGNATLTISGVTFEGADPTEFSVVTTPASSLEAGASTLLRIRFSPTSPGLKTASARIVSNVFGTANPFEIPFQGTGLPGAMSDSYANRLNLGNLASVSVPGSNRNATVEAGEKTFGGMLGGTVWAEWTAPVTGWYSVNTAGSRLRTTIALYSGGPALANLNAMGFNQYSLRLADRNFFDQPYSVSRLVFRAQAGTSYKIAVGAASYFNDEGQGMFVLNIEPEPEPTVKILAAEFSSASVDVTAASQPVDLDLTVESATPLFTTSSLSAYVKDASMDYSTRQQFIFYTSLDRISGTDTQGVYRKSATIQRHTPAGPWTSQINTYSVADGLMTWTPQGDDLIQDVYLIPSTSNTHVNVVNSGTEDEAGPTILSVTGFPPVVDVTSGNVTFDVDITFTDNASGIGNLTVYAIPDLGGYSTYLNFGTGGGLVSGNFTSGVWRQQVVVSDTMASGIYYPQIRTQDNVGNESNYTDKTGSHMDVGLPIPPAGTALTFEVIGTDPDITVLGPTGSPLADNGAAVSLTAGAPARTSASYDFAGTLLSSEFDVAKTGNCTLSQSGGVLQFYTPATPGAARATLKHKHFKPRFDQSWSIEATAMIPGSQTLPSTGGPFIDNGVMVSFTTAEGDTYRFGSVLSLDPQRRYLGLYDVIDIEGNGYSLASGEEVGVADEAGVVRIRFDAATKHLTAECGTKTLLTLDMTTQSWGMMNSDTFDVGLGLEIADVAILSSAPVTLDNFKATLGGSPTSGTFTISNLEDVDLTGLTVTKSGTNAADFVVENVQSFDSHLASGDTLTFDVRAVPYSFGPISAKLHIASNDPDESPFDINLTSSGSAQAPTALTLDARSVGTTTGTLRGLVNPQGAATTVTFEYGPTTSYGTTVAATPGSVAANASDTFVSAALTNLVPGTTYHYRVKAVNTHGTTPGADRTFTTPSGSSAGGLDSAFDVAVNGEVIAAATQPDGKLIIAGDFSQVAGVARSGIARLNANGTLDAGFNPTVGVGIETVAVQRSGHILLGGSFATAGGQTRNRVARLNADGTLDAAFNPNVDGPVKVIVPMADGRIFLGGSFTQVGGQPRVNIARLHADGTPGTFNTSTHSYTLSGQVNCIVPQPDGKIIVGGEFLSVGGGNRVVRINTDASIDGSFAADVDGSVRAVALQADGKIIIGGDFTAVTSQAANLLARLLTTGAPDTSFTPDMVHDTQGSVQSISIQADGRILVAGRFDEVDGEPRSGVVRLLSDGSLDGDFGDSGTSIIPTGITLRANGSVLVGGAVGASGLGMLRNDAATGTLTVTSTSRVQWLRGGTAPEAVEVSFELSTDGGSSWNLLGVATRITGGWERTGLTLPPSGRVRARASIMGAYGSTSSGLVETVQIYNGLPAPEIAVFNGNSTAPADERADNAVFDFGPRIVGASQTRTFTIKNAGTMDLTGIMVSLTGTGDFGITPLGVSTLAAGTTASFTVTFNPATDTAQSQTVAITSNDADESTFEIVLTGQGQIPPAITLDPVSTMTGLGQALSLTGAATGTAVQLQWLCNGSPVAGATAGTLSISSTALGYAGEWRLRASNGVGTAVSKVAHVGVVDLSTRAVTIAAGGTLVLQVPTAAPKASYRWLRGGVAIPRGINPETQLIVPGIASDQGGAYSLQVTMPMPELSPGPPLVMTSGVVNVSVTGGSGGGSGAGPVVLRKPVVSSFEPAPWITGAEVRAVVAATNSPTRFAVQGLPPGLRLDVKTGQITGRPATALQAPKRYDLIITASNAAGTSTALKTSVVVQPLPGYTAGNFHGLITRHDTVNAGHGGRFQLTVSPLGALTGRLSLGAATHGFVGRIDQPEVGRDVTATVVIARTRQQTALTLIFTIHRLTGELTGKIGGSADVMASVQGWHQTADAAPLAGAFQIVLQPEAAVVGDASFPQAASKLRVTVARQGGASWTGRLANGTTITGSSGLTLRDRVPVSHFNSSQRSSLQGWLQFEAESRICSGSLDWLRLSPVSGFPLHALEVAPAN